MSIVPEELLTKVLKNGIKQDCIIKVKPNQTKIVLGIRFETFKTIMQKVAQSLYNKCLSYFLISRYKDLGKLVLSA